MVAVPGGGLTRSPEDDQLSHGLHSRSQTPVAAPLRPARCSSAETDHLLHVMMR